MLGRLCLLALFLRWAADGVGWGAVAAFSGGAPGEESCQATDFLLLDEHKRQVTDTHTNKSIIARLTTTWSSTGVGMGVGGKEVLLHQKTVIIVVTSYFSSHGDDTGRHSTVPLPPCPSKRTGTRMHKHTSMPLTKVHPRYKLV